MRYREEDWPSPSDIVAFDAGNPEEFPWVSGRPTIEAVRIVAHSPDWAEIFDRQMERIAKALPELARHIDHVGSTAVPDLEAKPVIDIDLIIDDPNQEENYVPSLAALGYVLTVRETSWYGHRMLRHDQPRVNLHVFGPRCPEHFRHLLFRDWLRNHPEDRILYARAKLEALANLEAQDEPISTQDYNRNKEAVIRDIFRKIFESRGWLNV
jgi:GrpB-like predicted nucleotidyltransferase (UPF0157 family)